MMKIFVLVLVTIHIVSCQKERCTSNIECRACILQPQCAWCSKQDYEDAPRCDLAKNLEKNCQGHITNPENKTEMLEDEPLRADKQPIQITPQKVKLHARIGEVYTIKAKFADAGNNPVDLYYLMDLSSSMGKVKTQLAKVGDSIANKMKETTSNFRLGFGSFVDKEVLPFVDTSPEARANPCRNKQKKCVPAYSYKHGMTLSNDTDTFKRKVDSAELSSNTDLPEGGFDALMQVMVCDDVIGWRKEARKLLVFSTDAEFHVAGDGKLGGIVMPNDGQCHMSNGQYTESTNMDYPSVAHIRSKAKEKSINIIFAISAKNEKVRTYKLYQALKDVIPGSSVGILDEEKIADFIKQEYDKIRENLLLQYENVPDDVSVTFQTDCGSKELSDMRERDHCSDIKSGQEIDFQVQIEIEKWENGNKTFSFSVFPAGFKEIDRLDIEVEVMDTCQCDSDTHQTYVKNSAKCNNKGDLRCGICDCQKGYTGRQCECSNEGDGTSRLELEEQCKNPDTGKKCSDNGECKCGQCKCYESNGDKMSGKFCECHSHGCPRILGKVCGGPERGTCYCGTCRCNQKYQGDACDCEKSDAKCIRKGDNVPCSGPDHGKCVCGKCVCENAADGKYGGSFCEELPTKQGQCEALKKCVRCEVFQEQPEEFQCNTCSYNITQVDKIQADTDTFRLCSFYDQQDCRYTFAYDSELFVVAENTKECPEPVDFLAVVAGVMSALVLLALLTLLIWKVTTTIHDNREFSAFEEELLKRKFEAGTSPLYVSPQTHYKNPAFSQEESSVTDTKT